MDRYQARELALKDTSLSQGARLLYQFLDNYQREQSECWPGQNTLARDLGCSVRSVQRYLAELISTGLCRASRRSYGTSNSYVLHWRQIWRYSDDTPDVSVTTDLARHKANQALKPEIQGASAERQKPPAAFGVCRSCSGSGKILYQTIGWQSCTPCGGTGKEKRKTA